MLGFKDAKSAKQAYLQHYNSSKFFGSMTEMTFERFKESLKENKGKKLEKSFSWEAIDALNIAAIDLIKGGKKAAIGEIRTFGGREYVKTAEGWKFHGKGTGVKAKGHVESSGAEKTPESIIARGFKTIYDAKGCTDVSDCETNIEHVKQLLKFADGQEVSKSTITKLQVRLSHLSKRKEELNKKPTLEQFNKEYSKVSKEYLKLDKEQSQTKDEIQHDVIARKLDVLQEKMSELSGLIEEMESHLKTAGKTVEEAITQNKSTENIKLTSKEKRDAKNWIKLYWEDDDLQNQLDYTGDYEDKFLSRKEKDKIEAKLKKVREKQIELAEEITEQAFDEFIVGIVQQSFEDFSG